MRNVMVGRYGGALSRPGTELVAEVRDSTKTVRLIDFVFNSSQTYVLELGDLYMRVHSGGAPLLESASSITSVTLASPAVVSTSAPHGYATGDDVIISNALGTGSLNAQTFTITVLSTTSFQLSKRVNGVLVNYSLVGSPAYGGGGLVQRIYTLTTPWAMADLMSLDYAQSSDVVTVAHTKYTPYEIKRLSATSWAVGPMSIGAQIATPTNFAFGSFPAGGSITWTWAVTALSQDNEESAVSNVIATNQGSVITPTNPATFTWTAVPGAIGYNVYRGISSSFGLIGTAGAVNSPSFTDIGASPDYTSAPPIFNLRWAPPSPGLGGFPALIAYYQKRMVLGGGTSFPQYIFASRTGLLKNWGRYSPTQSDDSITMTVVGQRVGQVIHAADVGSLIVFTTEGEFQVTGDTFTPSSGTKAISMYGSTQLKPLVIGESALFVQSSGSQIRDLFYDLQLSNYHGNELSICSSHLVDGYTMMDWCYQKTPHSIVWIVRNDGTLLGLTYVKEQQITGWHRHDTDGVIENVCSIRENNEDRLYMVVKRTLPNGTVRRFIERMGSRLIKDQRDFIASDCTLTFDGRNSSGAYLTLAGPFAAGSTVSITASSNYFTNYDVGRTLEFTGVDGLKVQVLLSAVTSATQATGTLQSDAPVSVIGVGLQTVTRVISTIGGLSHLEGKAVSIVGDGFVAASPNNPAYVVRTVVNGQVALGNQYRVVHVGLPFTADMETLDVDVAQGETLVNKKMVVGKVSMRVQDARGLFVGPNRPFVSSLDGLNEVKPVYPGDPSLPTNLRTGKVDVVIRSEWNSHGRVFVRQVDPLPFSILSVHPEGMFPIRG